MILYVLKQNKNSKSAAFGKWFAFPVIEETIDLDALAEHMSNHNTPYSKGAIKGMLTDMVGCIKELLQEHQGRETACPCHRRTDRQEPEPGGYAEEGQRHNEEYQYHERGWRDHEWRNHEFHE